MADIKNITIDGTTYDLKDDKARNDITDLKEDFTDLPDYGYVPTAGQMMSDNVTVDTEPYSYRATPYGDREIVDGIVGGTVAFNQLAHNFENRSNVGGITITSNNNGSITVTGTATATSSAYFQNGIGAKGGHVYFVFGAKAGSVTHGLKFGSTKDSGNGVLNRFNTATTMQLEYFFTTGDVINETIYPNLIDLTQMFGASVADAIYAMEQSTAGSGVAYLKAVAPKMFAQYNPYNAGELMSVSGLSAHETVGFNLFDINTAQNNHYWSDAGVLVSSDINATTDKIRVIPNKTYYIGNPNVTVTAKCFDSNMVLLYKADIYVASDDRTVTMPKDAAYLVTNMGSKEVPRGYCINISDPTRNGEYQPYVKHSYALDDSLTLMGVPKWDNGLKFDGDRYNPNGVVDRNAIELVFDGSSDEDWTLQSINDAGIANFGISIYSNMAKNSEDAICNRFIRQTSLISQTTDEGFLISDHATLYIRISSSKANTVSAFKTWLASNPVEVVYLRQTTTTETAEPYQSVQVCPNGGTEEYISTSIVPVGHSTRYPENSRMKLDGLPWDFSTLIAPVEKTYVATRNYTTGKLLIVNNILYEVTANIANGGNIVPNTNVTATTLSEVIASL